MLLKSFEFTIDIVFLGSGAPFRVCLLNYVMYVKQGRYSVSKSKVLIRRVWLVYYGHCVLVLHYICTQLTVLLFVENKVYFHSLFTCDAKFCLTSSQHNNTALIKKYMPVWYYLSQGKYFKFHFKKIIKNNVLPIVRAN